MIPRTGDRAQGRQRPPTRSPARSGSTRRRRPASPTPASAASPASRTRAAPAREVQIASRPVPAPDQQAVAAPEARRRAALGRLREEGGPRRLVEAVLPRRRDELVASARPPTSRARRPRFATASRNGTVAGSTARALPGLDTRSGITTTKASAGSKGQPARDGPTVDQRRGDEPAEHGGGGVLGVPVEGGRDAQRVGRTGGGGGGGGQRGTGAEAAPHRDRRAHGDLEAVMTEDRAPPGPGPRGARRASRGSSAPSPSASIVEHAGHARSRPRRRVRARGRGSRIRDPGSRMRSSRGTVLSACLRRRRRAHQLTR